MWLSIYSLVSVIAAFAKVLSEPLGDSGGLRDERASRFHTGSIQNAAQESVRPRISKAYNHIEGFLGSLEQVVIQMPKDRQTKADQTQLKPATESVESVHADSSAFWYESITHNGQSPFIPNGSKWKVFRNVVTDYGADPTGNIDSTQAIINAIEGHSLNSLCKVSLLMYHGRWLFVWIQSLRKSIGYNRPTSGCVFSCRYILHQLISATLCRHSIDGKSPQSTHHQS